ncbi:WecB/TagA/CpsF family glycosyltransferase [Sphingomonas sp. PB2P19]|uniref:WecB/TagA/CpsF family glycosyltransferase n=1 Tax=Sphingomonas rhamnosi TaxID=3096156 RepID=UPI002FCA89DD
MAVQGPIQAAGQGHAASFHERVIGPVRVTGGTEDEAVAMILAALAARRPAMFGFCNAHSVNVARGDGDFVAALRRMTVFNDGIGLEIASRMVYGRSFPANLNGTDLTPRLLASLPRPTRIFLLGSPRGIAERAGQVIAERYPHAKVVGAQHGFFTPQDAPALAERIRDSGAALVLVGMGQPRQELWAAEWTEQIGAVTCCIGAFLDFTAGVVTRAPVWAQRYGLEWAYRLGQEPRRLLRRYVLGNPSFLLSMTGVAIRHRLGHKAAGQ